MTKLSKVTSVCALTLTTLLASYGAVNANNTMNDQASKQANSVAMDKSSDDEGSFEKLKPSEKDSSSSSEKKSSSSEPKDDKDDKNEKDEDKNRDGLDDLLDKVVASTIKDEKEKTDNDALNNVLSGKTGDLLNALVSKELNSDDQLATSAKKTEGNKNSDIKDAINLDNSKQNDKSDDGAGLPIDQGQTEKPVTPVGPTEPTTPVQPDTPIVPDKPVKPVGPDAPDTDQPTVPDKPGQPDTPVIPDNPGTSVPDQPSKPDNPGTDTPVTPDQPSKPDNPGTDTPVTPDQPSKPDNPGQPTDPDRPGTDNPDQPSQPDKPTDPDQPTVPDEPEKPTLTDWQKNSTVLVGADGSVTFSNKLYPHFSLKKTVNENDATISLNYSNNGSTYSNSANGPLDSQFVKDFDSLAFKPDPTPNFTNFVKMYFPNSYDRLESDIDDQYKTDVDDGTATATPAGPDAFGDTATNTPDQSNPTDTPDTEVTDPTTPDQGDQDGTTDTTVPDNETSDVETTDPSQPETGNDQTTNDQNTSQTEDQTDTGESRDASQTDQSDQGVQPVQPSQPNI